MIMNFETILDAMKHLSTLNDYTLYKNRLYIAVEVEGNDERSDLRAGLRCSRAITLRPFSLRLFLKRGVVD